MPKWNTENAAAREYLLGVAEFWVRECDIDGWRLDVAGEVSFDFWREFSARLRALKRGFYITGEIWHDASRWINAGYFDAVMQYPLVGIILECFVAKTLAPPDFTARLFRLLARLPAASGRVAFNLLDSHDTSRVLTQAAGDKQALKNAFTMLFLLPGSPCLYYGTEAGLAGGGDPDCRRPMLWQPDERDEDLFGFFKRLIALRKERISLINNSVIHYSQSGAVHVWDFTNGPETIRAVYDGAILEVET
jgi:glycosidase